MAKFTDTQLIMLSAARDDGIAVVPAKVNKAVAAKVGASLVARKLMRELRSKPGMPVWREDDDGRSISLMITRAGRDGIGVDESEEAKQEPRSVRETAPRSFSDSNGDGSRSSASTPRPLNVCAVTRRRFPVGASPTRRPLQPEASGAVMEVTKWLKPSV